MALTMDPPWSSMGIGPLIFHGKPMEYFCKGMNCELIFRNGYPPQTKIIVRSTASCLNYSYRASIYYTEHHFVCVLIQVDLFFYSMDQCNLFPNPGTYNGHQKAVVSVCLFSRYHAEHVPGTSETVADTYFIISAS